MCPGLLVSFESVLPFSSYKFYTSQICFIPKKVFFSDAIVNGAFSIIISPNQQLYLYMKTNNFCTLILHPAILLNAFIVSISFITDSLEIVRYTIIAFYFIF